VDELTTRDKVTGALMRQEGRVAWLVLGAEGSAMFGEGTLGFYGSKSLVKKVRREGCIFRPGCMHGLSADLMLPRLAEGVQLRLPSLEVR
jgi:hypothetical protein